MPLHYGTDKASNGQTDTPGSFTVEEAIEKTGFGCLQLRIYLVCKLIVATDALEVMLLSLVGPVVQCDWQLLESQVALISTAVFLGMAIASPLMGLLADHYGRRTTLLFSTLWTAFFGLLTSFSPSYLWLLLLRGLVGIGMGGIPQGYAMVAEYMPSKLRAKMIVFGEVFWAAGSLFEIMLATFVMPTLGWRWLLAISAAPVLLSTVTCFFIPESARFLMAAGKAEESLAILQRIATSNNRPLPQGQLVTSKKIPLASIRDLFSREYTLSTMLLWPIWFIVSFAYYGIVLASPYLLNHEDVTTVSFMSVVEDCMPKCHVLSSDDYISLATSTTGEIVGLFFSFLLIDRIGRRWTWRLLLLGAAAFLFLLQVPAHRVLITIFIFGVRGTTLTAFCLCFIYTVELYPTNIRALGLGLCTSWARLASMVTPFLAQMLMVYSVPITVTVYGVTCLLCTFLMFLLPIETLGRPMMQSISFTPEGDMKETAKMAEAGNSTSE